jgi:hypothetical protein
MKSKTMMMAVVCGLLVAPLALAGTVDDKLKEYQAQGASNFSAANGKAMWTQQHNPPGSDKARSCSTCHGENLTQPGKHIRTGKAIEPMAPSVNPQRFTDAAKIDKWFKRNCTWTLGRECSPQEKGDFLSYLRTL